MTEFVSLCQNILLMMQTVDRVNSTFEPSCKYNMVSTRRVRSTRAEGWTTTACIKGFKYLTRPVPFKRIIVIIIIIIIIIVIVIVIIGELFAHNTWTNYITYYCMYICIIIRPTSPAVARLPALVFTQIFALKKW